MKLSFKLCDLEDFDLLKDIIPKTFYEAFADQNTSENMDLYMEMAFSEKRIQSELMKKHSAFFLVFVDHIPAGYLKFNEYTTQTESMGDDALEIERIYLFETFQRKGIGKIMLDKAREFAKSKNKKQLWLGVWEENKDAIRFYEKYGFEKFGRHEFMLGKELQFDVLLKKAI